MEYTSLGGSGLEVSRICLGCMGFGAPTRGTHPWTLDADDAVPVIGRALDLGINFFDTANTYSDGSSEEILGDALRRNARRDEVVIASKVGLPTRPGPNGRGLSRKAIRHAVEDSLRRLGTDYLDLYQIHRWDDSTPIDESLEALSALVIAGKVLHVGASSMFAWQFATLLHRSKMSGGPRFVSMQSHYNALYREEEREMIPLCLDADVSVLPWSPLARGVLTRPWGSTDDADRGRARVDGFRHVLYGPADADAVDLVGEIAAENGTSMAQVALSWLLQRPGVTAPLVGAASIQHVDTAVAALNDPIDEAQSRRIDDAYVVHPVSGIEVLPFAGDEHRAGRR